MHELENKIAAWRAQLSTALPGREETVRELEAHLRDHIEAKMREGVTAVEAFAQGVAQMGETKEIVRAFQRLESPWTAASRLIAVVVALMVAMLVSVLAAIVLHFLNQKTGPLFLVHALVLVAGYLAVLGTGILGLGTLVLAWKRPLSACERNALRRAFLRFATTGGVLVPSGMILGTFWEIGHRGVAWSWNSTEIGALGVLLSCWLLLAVQLRMPETDRVRGLLAMLGCVVLVFSWICGGASTAAVPITWLCVSFIAAQAAVALLRMSPNKMTTRVAAEE